MNNDINVPDPQQHIFAEEEIFQYEHASTGQRFLNFLIDGLVMNYGISLLTGFVVAFILAAVSPDFYNDLVRKEGGGFYFALSLITILNEVLYYSFCEKVFRGYTLGKLITGTRAVREDGSELTWKDAFLRSLSRLVPFEPFSIWSGDGLWHDTWTKTTVIKSR
jgi:uncharacterized RDD family membrane protein YckC